MRMSENGQKLLAEWEGIRQTVYLDSAQKPTIGVGHLITRDELSTGTITINGSVV